MPTAIIYCAENTISGKKYVGMTTRTLQARIDEHYYKTTKLKHKFANALKCYPKDSWEWYVLAEVIYEKAQEHERFFIADLDTYNNGYNSSTGDSFERGEANPSYNPEICSVYNPTFGVVSGTRAELAKLYPDLRYIRALISNRQRQVAGWVLAEHKDIYEILVSRKAKPLSLPVTLIHPEHGTHTLFQRDFVEKFGLASSCISNLITRRRKTHKGWRLVNAPEIKD